MDWQKIILQKDKIDYFKYRRFKEIFAINNHILGNSIQINVKFTFMAYEYMYRFICIYINIYIYIYIYICYIYIYLCILTTQTLPSQVDKNQIEHNKY